MFKRNQQPVFQIPEEGEYNAEVVNWKKGKQATTYSGLTDTVLVTFKLENGDSVFQSMLLVPGPTSLVEKLFNATMGEDEESVHFDKLVGKECGVQIVHHTHGENTYANVVDIFATFEYENEEGIEDDEDFFE